MTKINIGSTHNRAITKVTAEYPKNSKSELNVGEAFDDSIRTVHIIEKDKTAILAEITQLRTALAELQKQLPQHGSLPSISHAVDGLVSSAQNVVERRKWYSVSIEGLLEATKELGNAASPLLSIAMKLVEILNKLK